MTRFLGLIALVAMVLFAVPASAQQEQDTSAIGRQGEGVPTGDVGEPQAPSDEGLTTRQGIETEQAAGEPGQAGQVAEEPSQTGVTERAAEEGVRTGQPSDEYGVTPSETETGVPPSETETATEAGGEMPTTASELPLALAAGVILMAAGVALRFAAGRR